MTPEGPLWGLQKDRLTHPGPPWLGLPASLLLSAVSASRSSLPPLLRPESLQLARTHDVAGHSLPVLLGPASGFLSSCV